MRLSRLHNSKPAGLAKAICLGFCAFKVGYVHSDVVQILGVDDTEAPAPVRTVTLFVSVACAVALLCVVLALVAAVLIHRCCPPFLFLCS